MSKKEAEFKIENKIQFTQMANSTVRDKNLTGLERAILMYILSHDLDRFKLTRSSIYGNFPDSKYSIKQSLVGLKNKSYLKILRNGFNSWKYVINDFGLPFIHNERQTDNVRQADDTVVKPFKNTNLKNKKEKMCEEEKRLNVNNQVQPEIEEEIKQLQEENNLAIQRMQQIKTHTDIFHTQILKPITVEELQIKSNDLLQKIGFGFTKNPRQIMNAIYRQLPDDFMVKEDLKDLEAIQQAINKYDSAPISEREAVAKRLYQGVEAMAKLYLIKKHGEEFRDVLYPKILNDNLLLYLSCNPTLNYCLKGFSNDIDGVYNEIVRITKKKREQKERDRIREEERYLERERIKAEAFSRPHYSDEDIHAMGLRTVPEILQAMQGRDGNSKELDKKYQATAQTITDTERERLGELLRIKMSNGNLDLSEENEYLSLNRKMKGNG